jgi:hypothetical protein
MSVVNEKGLPINKWLKRCEQGELIRGNIHQKIEWAIVAARKEGAMDIVILSGPGAPYWVNVYSPKLLDVPDILCLSYGKNYTIIPNYAGEMGRNEP